VAEEPQVRMNLARKRAGLLSPEAEAEYREFLDRECLDPLLETLCRLLDGTNPLFVPCELASKKPSVNYADLTHDNWDKFYVKKLYEVAVNEGNLAVKLGPISGDLCTIDLDRDELIEPFLELNPKLRETLRTKGKKGCQFWFKIDGPYPEKVVPLVDGEGKPVGEWRGGGNGLSTIYGVHESSARHIKTFAPPSHWLRYRFLVEKPIVTIRYEDIRILDGWTIKRKKPGERWKWSSNSEEE
jgi:hypothetical protein